MRRGSQSQRRLVGGQRISFLLLTTVFLLLSIFTWENHLCFGQEETATATDAAAEQQHQQHQHQPEDPAVPDQQHQPEDPAVPDQQHQPEQIVQEEVPQQEAEVPPVVEQKEEVPPAEKNIVAEEQQQHQQEATPLVDQAVPEEQQEPPPVVVDEEKKEEVITAEQQVEQEVPDTPDVQEAPPAATQSGEETQYVETTEKDEASDDEEDEDEAEEERVENQQPVRNFRSQQDASLDEDIMAEILAEDTHHRETFDEIRDDEENSGPRKRAKEDIVKPGDKKKKDEKASKWSDSSFDPDNENWGTYYDPQSIFCGQFDCYKILGFDYENFGSPPISEITKRYRALSRVWHPDKSKHKDAKERFVKIARAYEVLTTVNVRKEYDELRYDVEKYWSRYGTSVLWQYAPKSDTTMVIIVIMILGNVFSWFSQKHRWRLVADRLVKAAVEDWAPSQGGSPESKQLREEALAILQEQEKEANDDKDTTTNGTTASTSNKKLKGKKSEKKVSGKEKRRMEQEALKPIIQGIVYAMDDFGAGFHKPTWEDLLIVTLARFPFTFTKEFAWFSKYWIRRLQKLELNEEEKEVLTKRAVGPIKWIAASDEERQAMMKKELWVVANLAEWHEEQEFNKLSSSERKEYLRLKKRGLIPDKEE